jgi:hypothetical protein
MKLCWTALAVVGLLALGTADAGTLKVSPIKVTRFFLRSISFVHIRIFKITSDSVRLPQQFRNSDTTD